MRALVGFMTVLLLAGSAYAGGLSTELKVKLQSAMIMHMDSVVVNGSYSYVDTKSEQIKTVFPANVHPFVIEAGEDYFVCSEMINEEGDSVTADFLVRDIEGSYRVVQIIVNDRAAVKSAVKKLQ